MILLAEDTAESVAIYRVGSVVYKLLRPLDYFARHPNGTLRCSASDRVADLRRRTALTASPPFNPWLYLESENVIVSRYVDGRAPTDEERQRLYWQVGHLGVVDLSPENVIVGADGPVIIDFLLLYGVSTLKP